MQHVTVNFDSGTLLVDGDAKSLEPILPYLVFDKRVNCYRAEAYQYAPIILSLHRNKTPYTDNAKQFTPLALKLHSQFTPREHQAKALKAWLACKGQGVVVMPTGSGKSFLAMLAITHIQRTTLIVVPTIDLMHQWASQLEKFFKCKIGMLGGGSHDICDVTVSTYDSAVIHMEFIGNKFGFIIYDECHHLPSEMNKVAAAMCVAPYRLGLTATLERDDGGEQELFRLVGKLSYTIHIDELEGHILAPYHTKQIILPLHEDEADEYTATRKIYTDFLRAHGISFNNKDDWSKFIILCATRPNGRDVLKAFHRQKQIAQCGRSKFEKTWEIIRSHQGERIIIFTADNETAYKLGRQFFLPVITHQTKGSERKEFLDKFRKGEYSILVTSKVLNEGVDVPEASVGIIVSGSGSIREHVQRLGRILRAQDGKRAVLYELISDGTSEMNISKRRRNHRAYTSKYSKWSNR